MTISTRFILLITLLTFSPVPAEAEEVYCPTDMQRAGWTMGDMRSWKIALSAYQRDNKSLPTATTLEEARAAIEPKYIRRAPMVDAWGRAYRFELQGEDGFRLISAGADGKFEAETWNISGEQTSLAADAVATAEGHWLTRFWTVAP